MTEHLFEIGDLPEKPDAQVSVRDTFDVDSDDFATAFSRRTAYVPEVDASYRFDPVTTMALLSGFSEGRHVLVQGRHGSGKSTHVEQVAARLNWPCVRVNLDGHISRIDLIGKDAIILRESKQITEYREGILPWAYQRPVALVFDEYDAGRADVMFVIQRLLEADGRLTLLDQNRVLRPHPSFRLFATANTVGLGDASGLYHGTQQLNQAQLDRWNVIARLDYLPEAEEAGAVLARTLDEGRRAGRYADGADGRTYPCRLRSRRSLDADVSAYGHLLGRELPLLRRSGIRIRNCIPESLR